MVDTATLCSCEYDAWHVVDKLKDVREIIIRATGERQFAGNLGNLTVRVKKHSVLVSGSLPKFYFGTNLIDVSREDIKTIINCLSDSLTLKLENAFVYRLDTGINIIVDRSVTEYTQCLGEARYFQKLAYREGGVLYKNSIRSICFYDKMREMKKHKVAIPEKYVDCNILRYELRYLKRLDKHLKVKPALTAGTLYEEGFYGQLVRKMRQAYTAIKKYKDCQNLQNLQPQNLKEVQDAFVLAGIPAIGGMERVTELLRYWKAKCGWSNTKYHRNKSYFQRVINKKNLTEKNSLIEELNAKIVKVLETG